MSSAILIIALGAIGYWSLKILREKGQRNPRGLPYPPGPKGLPLIGNLLQIPLEKPWLVYKEWAKEHGDVIYLEALGQPMLVLNNLKLALDVLDKKSANFSDRPAIPTADLIKLDWSFPLMNSGPVWRAHRRVFHEHFNLREIPNYRPIMEEEVLLLLRNILDHPKTFLGDTKQALSKVIMRVSYGVSDPEYNQGIISHAEAIMRGFSDSTVPGQYLVNVLPFLRHFPSFFPGTSTAFPGTGWKRHLEALSKRSQYLNEQPWVEAKERVRSGGKESEHPSVVGKLIDGLPEVESPEFAFQDLVAKNTLTSVYVAGADTTISYAHAFYLAMALNPEAQRKAQEQIDSVVGKAKLPTYTDIDQLPYLRAIMKELGRWYTVGPLGLPHSSTEDDEYDGCFIPKGTVVFANIWAIFHDPAIFEDPLEFKPERYLLENGESNPDVLDPEVALFGFGRRICPGRHFSNEVLILLAASTLSMFDIKPAKDEFGKEIPLKLDVKSEIVTKPLPFQCDIVPRSEKHAVALKSAL